LLLREEVGRFTMTRLDFLSRLKMLKIIDPVGGSGGTKTV